MSSKLLTFPDEDLSVGAVVQDEAVVTNQQLLEKRALIGHFSCCHGTGGIRHLMSEHTVNSDGKGGFKTSTLCI